MAKKRKATAAMSETTIGKTKKAKVSKPDTVTNGKAELKSSKVTNVKDIASSKDAPVTYTHWLMKSEPESRIEKGIDMKFGIEDLKLCPNQTDCWDGVRNYQARNFMRDQMKVGHKVFFYHSNTKEPGIAGVCKVSRESYVDHTQFDSKDAHFDSKAKTDNPRWFMVDVTYERMMKRYIRLSELKQLHLKHKAKGGPLQNVALFTRARLSVQPLTQEEWDFIMELEKIPEDES